MCVALGSWSMHTKTSWLIIQIHHLHIWWKLLYNTGLIYHSFEKRDFLHIRKVLKKYNKSKNYNATIFKNGHCISYRWQRFWKCQHKSKTWTNRDLLQLYSNIWRHIWIWQDHKGKGGHGVNLTSVLWMKILRKDMELEFKSPCKDTFACSLACN